VGRHLRQPGRRPEKAVSASCRARRPASHRRAGRCREMLSGAAVFAQGSSRRQSLCQSHQGGPFVLRLRFPSAQHSPPKGCGIAVLHGDPAKDNVDEFFKVPAKSTIPLHWHTSAERRNYWACPRLLRPPPVIAATASSESCASCLRVPRRTRCPSGDSATGSQRAQPLAAFPGRHRRLVAPQSAPRLARLRLGGRIGGAIASVLLVGVGAVVPGQATLQKHPLDVGFDTGARGDGHAADRPSARISLVAGHREPAPADELGEGGTRSSGVALAAFGRIDRV